jgi:hypothetical protein
VAGEAELIEREAHVARSHARRMGTHSWWYRRAMTVWRTALALGTLGTALSYALLLCGSVYGCSGGSAGPAPQGSERQQCYPNGTCNAGLTCLSDVCVNTGTGADAAPADAPGGPADGDAASGDSASDAITDVVTCGDAQMLCQGACSDPTTDRHNCGACGHDCQGGACMGSACQPLSIASVAPGNEVGSLAIYGGTVYWTFPGTSGNGYADGAVDAASNAGSGVVTPIVKGQHYPWALAVDATNVYWTNFGNASVGAVMQASHAGTNVVPLATAQFDACGLQVDSLNVYWSAVGLCGSSDGGPVMCNNGTISAIPIGGGGSPIPIAAQQNSPFGVTASSAGVFWATNSLLPPGDVFKFVPDAGTTHIAGGQEQAQGIVLDDTNVYWATAGTPSANYLDGTVVMAPLSAAGPMTSLASALTNPSGIAVDSVNVYWTSAVSPGGAIMSVPIGGGAQPRVVAANQNQPRAIAVDATSIYWTTTDGVWKIAK